MGKFKLNITMTLDGYVAGPNQSLDQPLGEGAEPVRTIEGPGITHLTYRILK